MPVRSLSGSRRSAIVRELDHKEFDLIIIGGGITGAGIALDAASRGLSTVLLEMQDFAAGTSCRSTKLIHGGLRYLKQGEIRLVAEVGRERQIVYQNAPHVTTPVWMLLPIYKNGTFGRWSTSIGLWLYDWLAGVPHNERRKMLAPDEVVQKVPILNRDGLLGGGYYVEYRTDDARLTLEVIKRAAQFGAYALNYCKVTELIYNEKQKVRGVKVTDTIRGRSLRLFGKKIVNATGPWIDSIREMDQSKTGKVIQHTKGVHIVFDQSRFPLRQAVYFDTPDGRMVFAIPREGKTYVGTTDTVYTDELISPQWTASDRTYLLEVINDMFPTLQLREEDIESSWTGLRPLIHQKGKGPSEISRRDEIWQSPSGLISIAGGKLTGYRKMAEKIVDRVVSQLKREEKRNFHPCRTKKITLAGGDVGGFRKYPIFLNRKVREGKEHGWDEDVIYHLARRYGSNIECLFGITRMYQKVIHESQLPPMVCTELIYGIEEEMVVKPTDYFVRRTGDFFFNRKRVLEWKEPVIQFMASYLKWNDKQTNAYRLELDQELERAVQPDE